MWHNTAEMRKVAFTFMLAHRLLFPRRDPRRVVAVVCILGIALGLTLQIVVRGVMDGMIREIERGMQVILPDLVIENAAEAADLLRGEPGIHRVAVGYTGVAASLHGLCRYCTRDGADMPPELIAEGAGALSAERCLVSRSFAEKSGLSVGEQLVLRMPTGIRCLQIGGVYRVPGRLIAPEVLLHHSIAEREASLFVHLAVGADSESLIQWVHRNLPESRVHPTNADTQAWLGIIYRAKQTMGFILYFCTLLSVFACAALFRVVCLQRSRQFSVLLAIGMPLFQMRCLILAMSGIVGVVGVALGIPLAALVIAQREQLRQLFSGLGLEAFPSEILDMALPAHTSLQLYTTHSLLSLAFVALAAVPALLSLPRLVRQMPRV